MMQPLSTEFDSPLVGTMVTLTEQFGENEPGTRGIVYHIETDKGVFYASVILENGHDIGAFNPMELAMSLELTGQTSVEYSFTTPKALQKDFQEGHFHDAFSRID